jgi:hypothetical protein
VSTQEQDEILGRLVREHGDADRQRRLLETDIDGIADQLQKLAGHLRENKMEALRLINEHGLDVSQLRGKLIECNELGNKAYKYERQLADLGVHPPSARYPIIS